MTHENSAIASAIENGVDFTHEFDYEDDERQRVDVLFDRAFNALATMTRLAHNSTNRDLSSLDTFAKRFAAFLNDAQTSTRAHFDVVDMTCDQCNIQHISRALSFVAHEFDVDVDIVDVVGYFAHDMIDTIDLIRLATMRNINRA